MSDPEDDHQPYDGKRMARLEKVTAEQGIQIQNVADTVGRVVKKLDFIATELGKSNKTDWQTLAAWTMAILILISMAGWPILDRVKEVRADQKVMSQVHHEETLKLTAQIATLQENQRIYHSELPQRASVGGAVEVSLAGGFAN